MSKKSRKPISNSLVDVALLTAGVVEPSVFRKCIDSIRSEMQTVSSSFYVYRNGNIPETRQAYDEILNTIPNAKQKHNSNNVGFPAGANSAIRSGTSPLVLFISDDIILHQGTLDKLVKRMDDPTIGLCGLKLIFPEDSTDQGRPAGRIQHIGHAIDIRGEITHPLLGWKPDNPKCCISREVQSVTGAVFMVRRNVFIKAGGFFEGYGKGYFEDVDLNLTIRSLGFKVFIDAESIATHYTGATFIKRQEPVNMEFNKTILRSRKSNLMENDSWKFW